MKQQRTAVAGRMDPETRSDCRVEFTRLDRGGIVVTADLAEAISFVRAFLDERNAPLDDIIHKTGFERNAAIAACKEAATAVPNQKP